MPASWRVRRTGSEGRTVGGALRRHPLGSTGVTRSHAHTERLGGCYVEHTEAERSAVAPPVPEPRRARRRGRARGRHAGRPGGAGAEPDRHEDADLVARLRHLDGLRGRVRRARRGDVGRPAQDRPAAGGRGRRGVPGARRGERRRDRRRALGPRLLVRQGQGGLALRHRPRLRRLGHHHARLVLRRRRAGALRRADAGEARPRRAGLPRLPDARPAARLVQDRGQHGGRPPGLQVPHGGAGGRPHAVDGHERGADPRRRDRARHGARRDRRLRVQQPLLGPPLRRPGRGLQLLPRLLPPGVGGLRVPVQPLLPRGSRARPPGDHQVLGGGRLDLQHRPPRSRTTPRTCARSRRTTGSPSIAPRRTSCRPRSRPGTR